MKRMAGGSVSATFLYDADGNRVRGAVAGVTTVYIAGIYEYQAGATTKYYEGGALRRTGYSGDNGVFYALSDHLRSTSVLVNQNGTLNTNQYFYPYGGNRDGAFSSLTTKRFTGQYHEQSLPGGEGLAYYNARWYDAQVGVFVSADTLVPSPLAPQTLNRFAYAGGNPLWYTDPTGHVFIESTGGGNSTVILVTAPCLMCRPTPTPYPTAAPLIGPTATPARPVMRAAPTRSPTPYVGPWMGPATPLPPTATPHPYVPPSERINVPNTYWEFAVAFVYGIPEQIVEHSTIVRAGGRAIGHTPVPPVVLEGIGLAASVGPNVIKHRQQGEAWFSPEMSTDLIVDAAGWGVTLVTTPVGAGLGAAATTPVGVPEAGVVVGYLLGSVGVSIGYDVWVTPAVRPWVRSWFGN